MGDDALAQHFKSGSLRRACKEHAAVSGNLTGSKIRREKIRLVEDEKTLALRRAYVRKYPFDNCDPLAEIVASHINDVYQKIGRNRFLKR